jgi:hypothetical protein
VWPRVTREFGASPRLVSKARLRAKILLTSIAALNRTAKWHCVGSGSARRFHVGGGIEGGRDKGRDGEKHSRMESFFSRKFTCEPPLSRFLPTRWNCRRTSTSGKHKWRKKTLFSPSGFFLVGTTLASLNSSLKGIKKGEEKTASNKSSFFASRLALALGAARLRDSKEILSTPR